MVSESRHRAYFRKLGETLAGIEVSDIDAAKEAILRTYEKGGTVYIFGNGGSGATASHMAGDYVKGVSHGLERRFKWICLNDNYTGFTAVANDISFEDVFVEQLINFGAPGDLVIGLSGSGNSVNVVKAMEYAKSRGIATIAFCGYRGGKIKEIADISIHAEVMDMELSEDVHLIVMHTIKQDIISILHGESGGQYGSVYEARVK